MQENSNLSCSGNDPRRDGVLEAETSFSIATGTHQGNYSPSPAAVEIAISKPRLGRYISTGLYATETGLNGYMLNMELAESFHMPLQTAEVVCRNAIQKGLHVRFKAPWWEDTDFLTALDEKHRRALVEAISDESSQHGARLTSDHVVSSLTFGFWNHLLTARFQNHLWKRGIKHNFPQAHALNLNLSDINITVQTVRQWRNRIAHGRAVFDKDPRKKFAQTIELIRWVCNDTADLIEQKSTVLNVVEKLESVGLPNKS